MRRNILFGSIALILWIPMIHPAINFGSRNSAIKVSGSGRFHVGKNITNVDGTIITQNGGTITGEANQTIEFNRGIFESNDTEMFMVGTLDPNASLKLTGDSWLKAEPGKIIENLVISNHNNLITGQPLFASPISLFDSNSSVTLALHSKLNQHIILNGGRVVLESDLELADGITLGGSGTISPNSKSFAFGAKALLLSNKLIWDHADDLHLNGKLAVTNLQVFDGDSTINGHGNILDLTYGGTLYITSGSTLRLTDILVKGLGNGAIIFEDDTAQLILTEANFELAQNYTLTLGGIYVDGPSTFILEDKDFTFDQDASLSVDGVVLWTDRRGTSTTDMGTIVFGSPEANYFSSINSGTIKATIYLSDLKILSEDVAGLEVRIGNAETNIVNNSNAIVNTYDLAVGNSYFLLAIAEKVEPFPLVGLNFTDTIIDRSAHLDPSEIITIMETLSVDGNGSMVVFSNPDDPQLVIKAGKTLTLKDMNLQNVHQNTIMFEKCAKIKIEGHVIIGLTEDVIFNDAQFEIEEGATLTFYGIGGIRRLGFNSAGCCHKAERDKNRREFETKRSLNIKRNRLSLKNIEIIDSEDVGNYPGGVIELCGTTIINFTKNSDLEFLVKGIDNIFRMRDNKLTLNGKVNFGNNAHNKLNIIHKMPEGITESPIVYFGDNFLYLTSALGIAELIFDDDIVRVVNQGLNSFVVGKNSFLGGSQLQIWNNPIRQLSTEFDTADDLVITTNLTSATEMASGFYVPPVGDPLPEREFTPGLHGHGTDGSGTWQPLIFRQPFSNDVETKFSNSIVSFQNASGTICLDQSYAKNFNVHEEKPLILNLYNGTILQLEEEDVILKENDSIIVSGRNNVIQINKSLSLKGNLIFDEGGQLIFDFGNKEPKTKLYLSPYTTLNPDASIDFQGNGKVIWVN